MSVVCRTPVLGLALLLAAATAAADTVITDKEIISCRVVSADTNFIRLQLPQGGIRMLHTRDVSEIYLSDTSAGAKLVAQLPKVRIRPELVGQAGALDTLPGKASPTEMAARCREMRFVLRGCDQDSGVVALLREVNREEELLYRIRPSGQPCMYAAVGWGVGVALGSLLGMRQGIENGDPSEGPFPCAVGCVVGSAVGSVAGPLIGVAVGTGAYSVHRGTLIARHRDLVNGLVRRVNLAVAASP